jgi:ankyrin repeat protein
MSTRGQDVRIEKEEQFMGFTFISNYRKVMPASNIGKSVSHECYFNRLDADNTDDRSRSTTLINPCGYHGRFSTILQPNDHAQRMDTAMALMTACWEGNLDVVQKIIEGQIDVDYQNYDGDTALMYASLWGHHDVVQALLERNANVNVQNKYGDTALMKACDNGQITCVSLLLQKCPDLSIKNIKGQTAKNLAEMKRYKSIIDVLVEVRISFFFDQY